MIWSTRDQKVEKKVHRFDKKWQNLSRLVAFFECHPKSKKSTNMGAQANKIVIQPKVTIMADKFLNIAVSPNNEHY